MMFYSKVPNYDPQKIVEYPIIVFNKDNWDDYGHRILFEASLYISYASRVKIGTVKILDLDTPRTQLPLKFSALDKRQYSLWQSLEDYEKIKELFPENHHEILRSLRDIAIEPDLAKEIEEYDSFSKTLLRFSTAEKAFAEAKQLILYNKKYVNDQLAFAYSVKVPGALSQHTVNFDFEKTDELPFRINVIIGKNGTGKTQLLGSMVNTISGVKYQENFSPYNPLFRKVIAISYSLFDDFPKPKETTVFSYKYIGIRSKNEEKISDAILEVKLRTSLHQILDDDRLEIWYDSINKIIPLDNFGLENYTDINVKWIDTLSYSNAKRLSSGQSIILFILTELIASIKDESLILFDEPETHLHPSAIAELLNCLYEILERYKSFAIISTHSPIIIQDIPSKYITIFDRIGNQPIIRKLPLESFGENISTLTSKVFGTLEVEELYKKYLKSLANKSNLEIDALFKNDLSINAKLYIQAVKNMADE